MTNELIKSSSTLLIVDRVWHYVLMSKRSATVSWAERFECPGGKIDQGETPREAAVRELKEETGLIADARAPYSLSSVMWSNEAGEPRLIHIFFHHINSKCGQLVVPRMEPEKGGPWYWQPVEEVLAQIELERQLFLRAFATAVVEYNEWELAARMGCR